jgi:acetyl-CoA C-acetyltransferase
MTSRSVVFAEPVRTAIGTFGGSLKDVPAPALGATAIHAAVTRAGVRPDEVETVVMGNVVQAGTKMNPARQATVHAGLPVTTPALTVNRVCGSGAQAIVSAAQEILLGNINSAVAGGMENMNQAPYLVARARWGYRMGDGALYDSVLRDGLNDAFSDAHSGWHTEDLVEKYQVTRAAQDDWAFQSQQRFANAQSAGHFQAQIVPIEVAGKKGTTLFERDEAGRADTTMEALGRLKRARAQRRGCRHGRRGRNLGRETRPCSNRASCLLRHRGSGARYVRFGAGACSQAGAATRRLGHSLHRTRRDQRSVRGYCYCRCPRTRARQRDC